MARRARALLTLLPLSLASCVGPDIVATAGLSAAQTGVAEFRKGTLRTAWEVPIDAMLIAVEDALRDLGFEARVPTAQGDEWHVETDTRSGTDIDVYLTRVTDRVTSVAVRVGFFGDQPVSKLIADRIDQHVRRWDRTHADADGAQPDAGPG